VELTQADVLGLAVAILGGAAVGVERQHSGHATGPQARFGGLRTFTLLGSLSGIAGMLIGSGLPVVGATLLAGALALIVAAYIVSSERDVDATTEVAAFVVLAAGVLGGLGEIRMCAALTTLTVLVLAEKPRLHRMVSKLDEPTMLAAARFAVMSAVILPLLPEGPIGPGPGIRPRELWMLVLLFSGMSFVGFTAQRAAGAAGYPLTGLLGGLVSSTSVTLTFSRLSKSHPNQDTPLAAGVLAASAVMFVRVAVAVAVLNAALLPVLARYLAAPLVAAVAAILIAWRWLRASHAGQTKLRNPLQFRSALEMALLFQAVLFAVHYMREWVGETGLLATGFVLGLTDVDALTLSMSRSAQAGTSLDAASRAIAIGVVANSLMKAGMAFAIGSGRFRWQAGTGLLAMAAAGAAALIVWRV
jgi:uncharacterized membrane protein (DUF4010 family)